MLSLVVLTDIRYKQLVIRIININSFFEQYLHEWMMSNFYNFIFSELLDVLYLVFFFLAPNAKLILERFSQK